MGDEVDEVVEDYGGAEEEEDTETAPMPTLSDLLLTPEEKQARNEYRMKASACCINEAWRMYRRVINSENAIEPVNLSMEGPSNEMITRMGVLYDPTAGLRMRFLKKKFSHLLDAFSALRHAAYKPYIRCQRPKKMDIQGQGFIMPAVAKTFHPEVYVTYTHPSTFAYKEKWSKTFNRNFISVEDILRDLQDAETQTLQADVYSTKKIRRKDKERDKTVEKFDLEDIPYDQDGNPIGRSVGICEWCGRSILPIPSDYTLSVECNTDSLYCCNKYRLFIEESKKATLILEADAEKRRVMIDSRVKGKKKDTKGMGDVGSAKNKTMVGKIIKILQEKYEEVVEEKFQNVGVDTSDLPWDPAETRYHQQLRANAQCLSTGRSTLKDMDILIGLEEVYTKDTGPPEKQT